MSATPDRKAELAKKKQKLDELRRQKAVMTAKRKEANVESSPQRKMGSSAGEWKDADDIFKDLGIEGHKSLHVELQPSNESAELSKIPGSPRQTVSRQLIMPRGSLGVHVATSVDIAPVEYNVYDKVVQTDIIEKSDDEAEDQSQATEVIPVEPPAPPESTEDKQSSVDEDNKFVIRDLEPEEKLRIESSTEFSAFLERTSVYVERELSEKDYFIDYVVNDAEGEGQKPTDQLTISRSFYDEKWCRNRIVAALHWSPHYPELAMAAYGIDSEAPNDPDGNILIWNLRYHSTSPEVVFKSQSVITTARFASFQPNLVIGGTYSGQIVVWDRRSSKRLPVQRTPLSSQAHTHPVFCVEVVGTENSHNVITVSTDGKLCSWSLDMLSQPQDSLELAASKTNNRWLAVTSLACPANDVNSMVVGSEEGNVYGACRHGNKAGLTDVYERHFGPVTGVDFNRCSGGPIDFGHLFVSSSFDWTTKLWSSRQTKPLHTFEENADYVYDVRFSPLHPALFATVDGTGRLALWDINRDTEIPSASIQNESKAAINKCAWAPGGKIIGTGDSEGRIHINEVGDTLAEPSGPGEWTKLVHTLADLEAASAAPVEDSGLCVDSVGSLAGGAGLMNWFSILSGV